MEKLVVMVGLKQPGNNIQLLGSCFAVPKKGYFVTCRHVIGDHTDNLVLVSSVDSNNIHEYQDTSKINVVSWMFNPLNVLILCVI